MSKLPPLNIPDEGHTYCNDLLGDRVCTGAKMGIADRLPADPNRPIKLRMVRVRLVDGGAYAPNGAYFGCGQPLYHVESVDRVQISRETWWVPPAEPDHVDTVRIFRRAASRDAAKAVVRALLPNATFFR